MFRLLGLLVWAVALVSGQTVLQPAAYRLTGYYQPTLAFSSLASPSLPAVAAAQAQQQQQLQPQPQNAVPLSSPISGTGVAVAQNVAPPPAAGPTAVVNSMRPDGSHAHGYVTPDGQIRAETVQADGTTQGSYAYRTPDGQLITINYSAGRNGFQTSPGTSAAQGSTAAAANAGTVVPSPVHTSAVASPVTGQHQAAATPAFLTGNAIAASPSALQQSSANSQPRLPSPLVVYAIPRVGLPSFYPFTGFSGQSPVTIQDQAQSGTEAKPIQVAQAPSPVQTGATSTAGLAAPANSAPVGFSYGSNPQTIQQLQRILMV